MPQILKTIKFSGKISATYLPKLYKKIPILALFRVKIGKFGDPNGIRSKEKNQRIYYMWKNYKNKPQYFVYSLIAPNVPQSRHPSCQLNDTPLKPTMSNKSLALREGFFLIGGAGGGGNMCNYLFLQCHRHVFLNAFKHPQHVFLVSKSKVKKLACGFPSICLIRRHMWRLLNAPTISARYTRLSKKGMKFKHFLIFFYKILL